MKLQNHHLYLLTLLTIIFALIGCGSPNESFESGSTVEWETAVEILYSGDVEAVFQTHSLDVTLNLNDGRTIHTVEPGIDDIFDAIDECGAICAGIAIATE